MHRSSNQLTTLPLPLITGFNGISANMNATVDNTGWEFLVGYKMINRSDFFWQVSVNASIPRNKLAKFDGLENSTLSDIYQVGQPLTIQKKYLSKGVDLLTGLYKIVDVNQDRNVNGDDRVFINKWTGRKWYGGIFNTINYRNFDCSMLLQVSDLTLNSMAYSGLITYPGSNSNQPIAVLDHWQKPGDTKPFGKFSQSSDMLRVYGNQVYNSDQVIKTIHFMRLKTLSVSYRLPNKWMSKVRVQQTSLYLQGQNLLVIGRYYGFDPETGISLPPLRMITVGLNVKI
jgi:hypothetical protein